MDHEGQQPQQSPPHEIQLFMQQVGREMSAEYERIRLHAASDPGTAGDEGEENWKQLFADWLPANVPVVTKGQIIGIDGQLSPQLDVLILSPSYPHKLRGKKKYLAGGVLGAFECKLTLKKEHIVKSAETCRRVQEIAEATNRRSTMYTELNSPIIYGLLAHSSVWNRDTAVGNIDRLLQEQLNKDPMPRRSMDVVCVADLATWNGFRMAMPRVAMTGIDDDLWAAVRARNGFWEDGAVQVQYSRWMPWEGNEEPPSPVYVAISKILRRLAWEFPENRSFSDYWDRASVPGRSGGAGAVRNWRISALSPEVLEKVRMGALRSGVAWDEWLMGYW